MSEDYLHEVGSEIAFGGTPGRTKVLHRHAGGFAHVYGLEPLEIPFGGLLAAKTVKPVLSRLPGIERQFEREARLWMELPRHPHVLPCLHVMRSTGHVYVLTHYVASGTLELLLARRGLSRAEALGLMGSLIQALAHIESCVDGFHHGDIKPSNVLWDSSSESRVLLGDFGISYVLKKASGAFFGDRYYLAPEAIRKEQADGTAIDMYALGATMFEAITRSRLHQIDASGAVSRPDGLTLSAEASSVDWLAWVTATTNKMISLSPTERPQSFGLLSKELEDVAGGLLTDAKSPMDSAASDSDEREWHESLVSSVADQCSIDKDSAIDVLREIAKSAALLAVDDEGCREARRRLQRVVEHHPRLAPAWQVIAAAYARLRETEEARNAIGRAVGIYEAMPHRCGADEHAYREALRTGAEMCAIVGVTAADRREALRLTEKVIELDPENPRSKATRGVALLFSGVPIDAEALLREALEAWSNTFTIWWYNVSRAVLADLRGEPLSPWLDELSVGEGRRFAKDVRRVIESWEAKE